MHGRKNTMTNAEREKFLEKLASTIELCATPAEAAEALRGLIELNNQPARNSQVIYDENEHDSRMPKNMTVLTMSMLMKYKAYFEAWLDLSIERIGKFNGISVSSSNMRYTPSNSWLYYTPLCAFETETAVFVSCIPDWEQDINDLLADATVAEAISRLRDFVKDRKEYALTDSYHRFYGIETLNEQIDHSSAIKLDYNHYLQYCVFRHGTRPAIYEWLGSEPEITQDFRDMVDRNIHFCKIVDDKIVSMTESEGIPNEPDGIINLGINTINEYRRKGYAASTCAAFIKHNEHQGLVPVWQCDFGNTASQLLADRLGFSYIGNVYSISTLLKFWKDD
jgi:hypothetical protein